MPPLRLTNLLQTVLPDLSKPSRAVVSTLACLNGHPPHAAEVAAWAGLRDRYQLRRVLRSDGLPPFEQLAGWTRVLYWMCQSEETGASLLQLARREQIDPAAAYRLVRRVTGSRWSQLRRAGLALVVLRLRDDCHPRAGGPRLHLVRAADRPAVAPAVPRGGTPSQPFHPEGVLAGRVAIPGNPFDVAVTPARIALVTRSHAAAVELIQLPSLQSLGAIHTGAVPTRVHAARTSERAYVTSQFAEEIGILDLRSGRQAGAISLHGYGHPLGAALAPDQQTLYISANTDRLCAIALPTGRVTASVPIPQACPQLTVHPAGHRVFNAGWRKGILTEFDSSTLRTCRSFHLGGCVQDIVVTAGGDRLYAANEAGWLDVIALGSGTPFARIQFGTAAFGLALSSDETVLLVSQLFAGRIAVLDTETLRVRSVIETGGCPRLMARDGGGRGIVVANEAGWMDLIV